MLCRWGGSNWGRKFRLDFLPVSTRLHPQLQAGDRKQGVYKCVCVCLTQGVHLHSHFLISKSLLTSRVYHRSVAHTPNQNILTLASFLFSTSRFDLKQGQGSVFVTQTSTLLLGYTIPPTDLVPGPLNATAVCVCVCVCACVCVCVCVCVWESASQLSATLPHILSLPLFCLHASPSHYLYLSPSLFPPLRSNIRVAEQQSYGESKWKTEKERGFYNGRTGESKRKVRSEMHVDARHSLRWNLLLSIGFVPCHFVFIQEILAYSCNYHELECVCCQQWQHLHKTTHRRQHKCEKAVHSSCLAYLLSFEL